MGLWTVGFTRKAEKQVARLPAGVRELVIALAQEIEAAGPTREIGRTTQGLAATGITVT